MSIKIKGHNIASIFTSNALNKVVLFLCDQKTYHYNMKILAISMNIFFFLFECFTQNILVNFDILWITICK